MLYFKWNLFTLFIGSGLSAALAHFTLKIYVLRKKYTHIPGPPTKGILGFYLGNLIEILVETRFKKKIMNEVFLKWVKMYGKTIKVQVFNQMIVVTVDLNANKEIMIDRNFPKDPNFYSQFGFPYGIRWLGRGLITELDTTRWKHKRSFYNPVFNKQVISSFIDEFNSKGNILLENLRKVADGKTTIRLFDQFNCTALDIIAQVAFGIETDTLNDPTNNLNKCVTESLKGFFKFASKSVLKIDYLLPSEWFYYFSYKNVIKQLRQLGRDTIISRIEAMRNDLHTPLDLLSITLKMYGNSEMEIEDMIDDFITFFIAGQETTANALAFCFMELARNPLVIEKLRAEIDSVIGSRAEIKIEDLLKMTYLSSVVKESLRLWPPASGGVRRINIDDFNIDNLIIPKGSIMIASTYICGRYEEYFPNPLEFNPDRFFNKEQQNQTVKTYSYFPFSLGPRSCIGQNFANLEIKILLVKLIKNFDFQLDPKQSLEPVQYATIRPLDGTRCYIIPRKT